MKLPFLSVSMVTIFCGVLFADPSSLESVPVLDEVTLKVGKDELVIQRIEDPGLPAAKPEAPIIVPGKEAPLTHSFQIAATTYADKGTRFVISSHNGDASQSFTGWSNLDWTLFTTRHQLDDKDQQHLFILLHTKVSKTQISQLKNNPDPANHPPEVPTELPSHSTGARYLLTSDFFAGDPAAEITLDFLEALHALYDEQADQLQQEHQLALEKQAERKRQILLEKQIPQRRVLRFWRLNLDQKGDSQ